MNRFLSSPRSTNNNSTGYTVVPGDTDPENRQHVSLERDPDVVEEHSTIESTTAEPATEMEDDVVLKETENMEKGISIRILDLNGKVFHTDMVESSTIADLKTDVKAKSGVREGLQRLIFRGQVLDDEKTLQDYKVEDGHTIHLFARQEITESEIESSNRPTSSVNTTFDDPNTRALGPMSDTISAVVFPSDGPRRIDPLMLDSPLGNCARRVKLWSSFLLIIYTMKVLSQFALMANIHENNRQSSASSSDEPGGRYPSYYSRYLNQDPLISAVELIIHAFGVYVGCLGFKAAHDTILRQVRAYCNGLIWLAIFTIAEQIYMTVQIAHSNYPEQSDPMHRIPSLNDVVTANILQTCLMALMWIMAIYHGLCHKREVARHTEILPVTIVNPATSNDTAVAAAATENSSRNSEAAQQEQTSAEML